MSHPAEREAADAPSCVFRLLTSSPSSLSESGVRGGADVSCGNLQDEADLGGGKTGPRGIQVHTPNQFLEESK